MGKEENLHPGLKERWQKAKAVWDDKHPHGPMVILTCTYRSPQEQEALYAQGRTKPGQRVTNARGGQSLHNYFPALAFDVGFLRGKALDWSESLFNQFAALVKPLGGIEWGGDWKNFKDMPHFQPKGMTWQKAAQGIEPVFGGGATPIPKPPIDPTVRPLLVKGSSGEAVRRVQVVLTELGYYDGDIDEDYGGKTFEAVRELQGDYSLYPDGKVGTETWKIIERAEKAIKDGTLVEVEEGEE